MARGLPMSPVGAGSERKPGRLVRNSTSTPSMTRPMAAIQPNTW